MPVMPYLFIHSPAFDRSIAGVVSDDELWDVQAALCESPEDKRNPVISGTGGFRKMRWDQPGRGKSGGVRILYLFLPDRGRIHLILAYPKNRKEDITKAEKNALRRLAAELKAEP